jgi:hypothetical protein
MDYKLMICTPFYEVKAYSPYITSLVDTIRVLHELGVDWTYREVSGDSYVDRAKNTLVHNFLESDYTHLMMIDSDHAWDIEGFARLLKASMAGAEIIGAAYPCKNNWEFYGCQAEIRDGSYVGIEVDGMRLLEMVCIPGGFLIYSRAAFERARPNLKSYLAPDGSGGYILEAFRCNIEDSGVRLGEDVYFQQRYREAGGLVLLEPNVTMRHFGTKAWTGNYHVYLLTQREKEEPPQDDMAAVKQSLGEA